MSPGGLSDPERRRVLTETGLAAEPDPVMEVFAQRVRDRLGVPVALVSLVWPHGQVLPGAAGLPEPWSSTRCMPLTHSFCRHVVVSGESWVVADARQHVPVGEDLAVSDVGMVAYAGAPLTDEAGLVLGSLGAIDTAPREWTAAALDALHEIADSCSTELRLRLARFTARAERTRRDEVEDRLRSSFDRSQALLAAAQSFTDTVTVEDVRRRVGELVVSQLHPSYVGLTLLDDHGRMHRLPDPRASPGIEDRGPWASYALQSGLPTATAARERRLVVHTDRASFDADHEPSVRALLRGLGLHALVVAPLLDVGGAMGAVAFGWDAPRSFDPPDLLIATTITGFAAQALARARHLEHRTSAAEQLQQAMLPTLPAVSGLDVAARYEPADSREHVGGDWYDLITLPDDDSGSLLVLSVGDITGHDLHAATIMGQTRSMLRQAAWDHRGRSPSVTLSAFEQATAALDVHATGTTVLAHLRRGPSGSWAMTWTNAGHPPPILVPPDAPPTLLDGHDILFGYPTLRRGPRRDHHCDLPPGSSVFLHTDGLVERRGSDLDAGTEALLHLLDDHRADRPRDLVDAAVDTLAADSPDDVVAVAVRLEHRDGPTVAQVTHASPGGGAAGQRSRGR